LWRRYVARTYALATRVQALNAEDAATLAARLRTDVAVRPPAIPVPARAVPPAAAPPRMHFLRHSSHHPNREAATPSAPDSLWLAGRRASRAVEALAALPGVRVLGFVDDLQHLLGAVRCVVAPVFSGSGSRIKVLTALAHGLPVVTNALGARGAGAPPPGLVAVEGADAVASAAVRWLAHPPAARAAGDAARRWALAHVSPDAVASWQLAAIQELLR